MHESILNSVKQKLGIDPTYTAFDDIIVDDINTAFMTLRQLGVGPDQAFHITGVNETWDDFLEDKTEIDGVKTYLAKKVGRMFDPPQISSVAEAQKENISELEFRLNVEEDYFLTGK